MEMAHRADRINVRAIIRTDVDMAWWEGLEIPVWGSVGFGEDFVGEEGERWSVVAGREDDDVGGDVGGFAGAVFGDALCAEVVGDAGAG